MVIPLRPRLRGLEIIPVGEEASALFALRDPEGISDTLVVPYGAALLAALMDGRQTLAEIQSAFKARAGSPLSLADLKRWVAKLDEAHLLVSERFETFRQRKVDKYLARPSRPASHAGGAYADDPGELREELAGYFSDKKGPGPIDPHAQPNGQALRAVISPHIDPYRGGPAYAWAYKRIVEHSDADVFVILGTAHAPLGQRFTVTRKDFETPLGTVRTDVRFLDRLVAAVASEPGGEGLDLFEDEFAHCREHSIEFQAVFLQYVLGHRRRFAIVPVLCGSMHEFVESGQLPIDSPEVRAMVGALRRVADEYPARVCFISGADLAHIGQRFGDEWLLDDQRLAAQRADDCRLLEAVCRGDSAALFRHIADQADRSRICGLAPIYTMLEVLGPVRGEPLAYDQAVEANRTACVSFASLVYYGAKG